MKIKLRDSGLFVEPETDFEAQYLQHTYPPDVPVDTYVKCGISVSEVLGLVIKPRDEKK